MKRNLQRSLALTFLLGTSLFFSSCQKSEIASQNNHSAQVLPAGQSASASASEDPQYLAQDVEVELSDEGRKSLLENGHSEIRPVGEFLYRAIQQLPPPPGEPIICDGMTYSELWADIGNRYQQFMNSSAGRALQDRVNANCRPAFFCISNCMVAVMYVVQPTRRCISLEEVLQAERVKATRYDLAPR